jgi:hypothetical protein
MEIIIKLKISASDKYNAADLRDDIVEYLRNSSEIDGVEVLENN